MSRERPRKMHRSMTTQNAQRRIKLEEEGRATKQEYTPVRQKRVKNA